MGEPLNCNTLEKLVANSLDMGKIINWNLSKPSQDVKTFIKTSKQALMSVDTLSFVKPSTCVLTLIRVFAPQCFDSGRVLKSLGVAHSRSTMLKVTFMHYL